MFHIIRAFHVAGRCTDCGECSRVCPQHIPLHLLNRKFIKDIDEFYGEYQAGADTDSRAPLTRLHTGRCRAKYLLRKGVKGCIRLAEKKCRSSLPLLQRRWIFSFRLQNNGITNFGFWTEDANVDLDTLKTVKSPKDAFFPQSEILYSCYTEGK